MPKFNGRDYLLRKLNEWEINSVRAGGLEYLVATNLIIIEELQKLNGLLRKPKEPKSMLDVS